MLHSLITTKGDVKAMRYKLKTRLMSMLMLCIFVITLLPFQNTFAYNNTATNLTQSTNVTVSKSIEEGLALGVIDGDVQSANKATQNAKGAWTYYGKNEQWICIDLGNIYCIDEIKAYFGYAENGSQRPESFRMYYSADGKNYKTLASENEGYNYNYTKALTDSVWARFIKLTIDAALQNRVVRVREIEVYGCSIYDSSVNITQNADVKLSASIEDGLALGVIDGDNQTANKATQNTKGAWTYYGKNEHWICIDLGNIYCVDEIKAYFGYAENGSQRPESFRMYYSVDGKNYKTLASENEGYNYNYIKTLAESVTARFIKLTIDAALQNRAVRVREIDIYGYRATDDQIGGSADIKTNNEFNIMYGTDAYVDINLKNLTDAVKTYIIEYSFDGKNYNDEMSGQLKAFENKKVSIDLCRKYGKYPNFCIKIYLDDILIKKYASPITIIKRNTKKSLDEYSRIGVNWHIEYQKNKLEKGKYNQLINMLGISNTRSIHRWAWLEKKKGERLFEKNDEADLYMAQYGQNFSPYILGFANPLYFEEEPRSYADVMNEKDYNRQVIDDLTQKGIDIKSLEIWNEPNLDSFWKSTRSITYSQFANRMGFEMKKLYPDKQIMGAAIATNDGYSEYLDKYFERGALMYVDEFSFHPYTYAVPSKQNTYDTQYYNKLKNIMQSRDKAGGWVNATATEIGYPTQDDKKTNFGITDEVQAALIPKYYVMNDDLDVALTDLYTFEDTGDNASESEENYGLVQYDMQPKNSYVSMAQLVNKLDGSEYIGRFALNSNDYMYVYTTADGLTAVTWSSDKSKTFEINLPRGTVAEDLYGNIITNDGGKVSVTYSPVYLTNIPDQYLYNAVYEQAQNKINEISVDFLDSGLVNSTALNNIVSSFETADTKEKLKSAVDGIYLYGNEIINNYASNSQNVPIKDLATILAKLERCAKHGLIAYSHFNIPSRTSDDLYNDIKQNIAAKKGNEPESSLLYTDAMMRFAERYNKKSNEIRTNYSNFAGVAAAYDEMAIGVLNWIRGIIKYEQPNIGRAVFTYLENTNPDIIKGTVQNYTVEIENQLSEHTIDGDIVLKDENGNSLGETIKCTVMPDECKKFTVSGTVPYNTANGKKTLYIELVENGKIIKQSEIEANILEPNTNNTLGIYDIGIYNSIGDYASGSDFGKNNIFNAKALIVKSGNTAGNTKFLCAAYSDSEIEDVKIVSLSEKLKNSNEYLLNLPIQITGKTDSVKLFVWDINNMKCLMDCTQVKGGLKK